MPENFYNLIKAQLPSPTEPPPTPLAGPPPKATTDPLRGMDRRQAAPFQRPSPPRTETPAGNPPSRLDLRSAHHHLPARGSDGSRHRPRRDSQLIESASRASRPRVSVAAGGPTPTVLADRQQIEQPPCQARITEDPRHRGCSNPGKARFSPGDRQGFRALASEGMGNERGRPWARWCVGAHARERDTPREKRRP